MKITIEKRRGSVEGRLELIWDIDTKGFNFHQNGLILTTPELLALRSEFNKLKLEE